jgi:hypothetical protein
MERPWLPEGALENATLDPRTTLVLHGGEGGIWTVAALAGMVKLYPRMVAMLRKLEWADTSNHGWKCCAICGWAYEPSPRKGQESTHRDSCPLDALLNEVGRG